MVLKVYRKKIWFLKIFPNGHPKSIWASLSLPCIWAEALVPVGIRAFDWADLEPFLQPSKKSQKKSDPHHIRPPMEKKSKKPCLLVPFLARCSCAFPFALWTIALGFGLWTIIGTQFGTKFLTPLISLYWVWILKI